MCWAVECSKGQRSEESAQGERFGAARSLGQVEESFCDSSNTISKSELCVSDPVSLQQVEPTQSSPTQEFLFSGQPTLGVFTLSLAAQRRAFFKLL